MTRNRHFIAAIAATVMTAGLAASPASAQSTEEVLGALIGGSAGAYIGGEIDNKGSKQEGEIIGALVGGTLGYVIGEKIDDGNDRNRYVNNRYRYSQNGYRTIQPRTVYRQQPVYRSQPNYRRGQPVYRDQRWAQPVVVEHGNSRRTVYRSPRR